MRRKKGVLFAAASCFIGPSLAHAAGGNATILYPLSPPTGFDSGAAGSNPSPMSGAEVVGNGSIGGNNNAIFWNAAGTATNLNPTNLTGFTDSYAVGVSGTQQVGYGDGSATAGNEHALLWSSSAATAVDLNPTNLASISNSFLYGSSGTQQVGFGFGTGTSGNYHALLWSGAANTVQNLNPTNITGITNSIANATDGSNQVGYGYGTGTSNNAHALLWSGASSTAVDLNPTNLTGITTSAANGVDALEQVGYGLGSGTGLNDHAMLWTGTAGSAVDLNPSMLGSITGSVAQATNGSLQVGYAFGDATGDNNHAIQWSGTAQSAVDLQALLPSSGAWVFSTAYAVNSLGDTFGTAYGTYNGTTATFAVEWAPITAGPASLTWNNLGGSGNGLTWDTSSQNWNNGSGVVAYNNSSGTAGGDNVTFSDANNGHYNVSISGAVSPGSVTFNNGSGNYAITGVNASSGIAGPGALTKYNVGTVTLSTNNNYSGGTNVLGGKLILGSANAFPAGTALTVAGGATVDITKYTMAIANTSIGTINQEVAAAFNNGAWNGTNSSTGIITSSAAASDTTHLTAIGVASGLTRFEGSTVPSTDVLVKYTYYGDADLSGVVDASDYSRIDNGYVSDGTLTGWQNGDFNYDGVINGSDYALIDNAFNTQGAVIASQIAIPTAQIAGGFTVTAAVPEPTAATMTLCCAYLARRRRGSKKILLR